MIDAAVARARPALRCAARAGRVRRRAASPGGGARAARRRSIPPPPAPSAGGSRSTGTSRRRPPCGWTATRPARPSRRAPGGPPNSGSSAPSGGLANVFVHVTGGLDGRVVPGAAGAGRARPAAVLVRAAGGRRARRPAAAGPELRPAAAQRPRRTPPSTSRSTRASRCRAMRYSHTFSTAEVMVPMKCDVHAWMNAWIGVVNHPYFAVTGADGTFSLPGLPPGTYAVEAWHEAAGTQSGTVTVTARGTADSGPHLQGARRHERALPPRTGDRGRARGRAGAVGRRRLRRADQAAPQHAGRDDHAGGLLRGPARRRAAGRAACTPWSARRWSPAAPRRSTRCGSATPTS